MAGWFDQYLQGTGPRVNMPGQTVTTPSTGPFTRTSGDTLKGPQDQPPLSLEDLQRIEQERLNDPNRVRQAGAGGGGDPQQQFLQIMGGLPATPENLTAKEAELKAAGIEVKRNAAGIAGKIGLSDGEIIDVVPSAGTGGGGSWQWLRGPDREGTAYLGGVPADRRHLTGTGGGGGNMGQLGGVNYASRQGALEDTPGFKFRLDQGIQALDRSAASKGTLLSGGHLKELAGYASGLASQEYGNEWERTMGLANLGFGAASAQGAFGSSYGNQMTDLTTGAGNAQAAGTAAAGQAAGNMWGNLGDLGLQYGIYQATRPGPTSPATPGFNPYGAAGRYYPAGTFNV